MTTLTVDTPQRLGKMRAHTATHLLHFALDQILQGTKQAGSLVDTDLLRFDFAASQALTADQLNTLQSSITAWIRGGYSVTVLETTLDEAKKLGAKAFFEDKYGDRVRVVSIAGTDRKSVELCGGTHVSNTADIGACLIISQESISSGVRRITAVTGPAVSDHALSLADDIQTIAQLTDAQPSQIQAKITKLMTQLSSQAQQIESLNTQIALGYLNQDFPSGIVDRIINITNTPLQSLPRKDLVTILKSQDDTRSRLLYTTEGNYALSHPNARTLAKEHELRGGGAPNFVQGKDTTILSLVQE